MASIFDVSEAKTADAAAIASLFAFSWTSPFTRLQFGQVDPAHLAGSMLPRIVEQMVKVNSRFIVARHKETQEIAAVAQWTVPIDEKSAALKKETQEDNDERQQFEDEAYRRSLPKSSNKALIMEFTVGLRHLREQTLRGSRHFLLENLATHPDHRGLGLASRLIEWIFPYADEQRMLVYLDTASDNPAARLYKKLGFEEQGRHTIEDLSKFAAIEDVDKLGCDPEHTHVAFLRFPKTAVNSRCKIT
jgi:ribosomal protein S18 acetylase RimI-like enzyme